MPIRLLRVARQGGTHAKSVLEAMKTLDNPGKNLLDVRWHAHLHELTATQDQLREQGAQ